MSRNRKVLLIIGGVLILIIGYLVYDYVMWAKYLEPDPSVSLYGWTDAQGVRHFTDRPPPEDARDVKITHGFKHRRLPLVLKAKEKIVGVFRDEDPKKAKKPQKQK